jgi:hypothetical protein
MPKDPDVVVSQQYEVRIYLGASGDESDAVVIIQPGDDGEFDMVLFGVEHLPAVIARLHALQKQAESLE